MSHDFNLGFGLGVLVMMVIVRTIVKWRRLWRKYEGKKGGSVPKIPDVPDTRHAEATPKCELCG